MSASMASAQNQLDVFKLSQNKLSGTARSVSMGGAFGALGGDLSGVAINPAGIAVYQGSEFVATMNFKNVNTETNSVNGYKSTDNKFNFNFDNIGYIASVSLDNYDIPKINFGFSYNRLMSYDRKYKVDPGMQGSSLTDYIAYKSYGVSKNDLSSSINSNNEFNPPVGTPWLSALAYQSFLINPGVIDANGKQTYVSVLSGNESVSPFLNVEEKGGIDKYDFTAGATISNKLNIGVSLSVTNIDYTTYTDYSEGFEQGTNNGFALQNYLNSEGSGFQFNLGLIYKPVNAIRIGLAYQSPTWYSMTDHYSASIIDNIPAYASSTNYTPGSTETGLAYADYNMRTPDRWTFSLAGVIGQTAIISADYVLTNYKNMHMSAVNGSASDLAWFDTQERYIKEDFKAASTLRLGAELRFTPQFSARVGYMWQQSPLQSDIKSGNVEVIPSGTLVNYTLDGDANYFTYGLGYRFSKSFYTDVAFVMKSQKADVYLYSNIYANDGSVAIASFPSELKTNTFSGLLTLGDRKSVV